MLLFTFQYDFSKEKAAIEIAEEERLNHLRLIQKNEEEARILQEELKRKEEEENKRKQEEDKARETETIRQQLLDKAEADRKQHEQTQADRKPCETTHLSSTTTTILTPLVITGENNTKIAQQTTTKFDVHEFETQNQNPFEMVELQTLDELNELRSVLDPELNNTPKKFECVTNIDNVNESNVLELSSFLNTQEFNSTVLTVADTSTAEIIDVSDTPLQASQNFYMNSTFGSVPIDQTLQNSMNPPSTWTSFEASANNNYYQNNENMDSSSYNIQHNTQFKANLQNLSSKTPPPGNTSHTHNINNPQTFSHCYDDLDSFQNVANVSLPRTKSLPNLQEDVDSEYVNLTKSGPTSIEARYSKSQENPFQQHHHQQQQQYPTERLENIMKQYQFQRIPASQSNTAMTNNTNAFCYSNPVYEQLPTSLIHNMTTNSASAEQNVSSNTYMNFQTSPLNTTSANAYSSASTGIPSLVNSNTIVDTSNTHGYAPPGVAANFNSVTQHQSNNVLSMNNTGMFWQPRSNPPLPYQSQSSEVDHTSGPMMVHSRPVNSNEQMNKICLSTSDTASTASASILGNSTNPIPGVFPKHNVLPPISTQSTAANRIYSVSPFTSTQPASAISPPPPPQRLAYPQFSTARATSSLPPPPLPFPRQPITNTKSHQQQVRPNPPPRPKSIGSVGFSLYSDKHIL